MSMLEMQADELRKMAVNLGVNGVCTDDLSKLCVMLNEAADTIENMRDRLQGLQGVTGESRYTTLFGTSERAARTLEEFELDQISWCHGTDGCEKCPYEFDRYGCCLPDGFSLLEWLRGDA